MFSSTASTVGIIAFFLIIVITSITKTFLGLILRHITKTYIMVYRYYVIMSNNPNPERKMTTIAVSKDDKEEARKFAQPTSMTSSGTKYESDAEIYHKMLEFYKKHNTPLHTVGKRTYSMDKVTAVSS